MYDSYEYSNRLAQAHDLQLAETTPSVNLQNLKQCWALYGFNLFCKVSAGGLAMFLRGG